MTHTTNTKSVAATAEAQVPLKPSAASNLNRRALLATGAAATTTLATVALASEEQGPEPPPLKLSTLRCGFEEPNEEDHDAKEEA